MIVVHSDAHRSHAPALEIHNGMMGAAFEHPGRVEFVLDALRSAGFDDVIEPENLDHAGLARIHDGAYLGFLETAWQEWQRAGFTGQAIPTMFPNRRLQQREPENIDGRLGYWSFAAETSIVSGTWEAVTASAAVAQTAAQRVAAGAPGAFGLCRPPGHHAARDMFGGYCFVNNAALAADRFLEHGAARVGIIDVDFHHGNGTQDIFYERSDVSFASIHGDPAHAFPYFLGYANETGSGAGVGSNHNFPIGPGASFESWFRGLDEACRRTANHGAQALVVSLGVDIFENDPLSFFRISASDFPTIGAKLRELDLPTVFVLEGGYGVPELGTNVVNVLRGFEGDPPLEAER